MKLIYKEEAGGVIGRRCSLLPADNKLAESEGPSTSVHTAKPAEGDGGTKLLPRNILLSPSL